MRSRAVPPRRMLVGVLLLVALLPGSALAKSPRSDRPTTLGIRRAEPTVARGSERIGTASGVPRALYNVGYAVVEGEPEEMARQYLRENGGRLRLSDPQLGDLVHRATRRGLAGTTVRFEQRFQGIPVLAADLAVTIDRTHRVTFVTSGYQPGVSVPATTPAVSAPAARASALAWLAVEGALAHEAIRLVVVPEGKQGRLAWQVQMVPAVSPTGDWEVLVDARTGDVFGAEDRAHYVDGSGQVFDPDPLSTAGIAYGSPGYTDGSDATSVELDAARATRTLLDLTDVGGGTIKLQGPYAEIVDSEAPFKGLFTQVGTSFVFDRAQDGFEAVNTYFHIDQIMRHVNLTLGVAVMPPYGTGVRFDPSGLNGTDNSHYVPSTGQLAFGEGGVDDAEDADVVIHELGHGLHDWLTAGGLSQVEGLSEGLGDYVAQSYSRSLGQWNSSQAPYHWVFNWDGHNPFWGGRTTNYAAPYPGGLVNQIHTDGQIWASSLMKIWDDVGRNKTDAAVFEGIAMTNSGSSQNDAAQAVLQAAVTLGYTPAEIASFVTHFQNTGYDVSAGIDYISNAITDECSNDATNENGVIEPGETVEVAITVEAPAFAQTGVTGVLTSTTPGVTIVDGAATWPDLAAGVPAASDAPHFRIAVDGSVACYSTAIDLQLSLSSNEGGPFLMSFSRPVGQTPTPAGLPAVIPDGSVPGVTSTLAVDTDLALTDVNVRVQIAHPWVGDLHIKLRSPLGTEVVLLDRPRYPATPFGCGDNDMDVTFDDAATLVPETHCLGMDPWYAGSAKAAQLLSAFNGQSSLGNWVLTVSDRATQDVGTVLGWELITTPPLPGVCDPCLDLTGVPIPAGERRVELGPNYPNPFSRSTEIVFRLARPGRATLRVYDVAGQIVATLVDRELAAGPHVATWDGRDLSGNRVASGLYFYRLRSDEGYGVRRLLLIK